MKSTGRNWHISKLVIVQPIKLRFGCEQLLLHRLHWQDWLFLSSLHEAYQSILCDLALGSASSPGRAPQCQCYTHTIYESTSFTIKIIHFLVYIITEYNSNYPLVKYLNILSKQKKKFLHIKIVFGHLNILQCQFAIPIH